VSKKSKRILALLNDPRHRNRLLETLNRETLDEGAPVSGGQDMTILKDMNSLEREHDQYVENLKGRFREE